MEDNLTTQLSETEKVELEILEGVIGREMKSFMAVGKALFTIRNNKLYREQYRSFKEYCTDRWGMSNSHANKLISGSQVAANLGGTCEIQSKDDAARPQL